MSPVSDLNAQYQKLIRKTEKQAKDAVRRKQYEVDAKRKAFSTLNHEIDTDYQNNSTIATNMMQTN